MRTTKTLTISLPPPIMTELDEFRKKQNFTRSELVRHALRELFYRQFPVYKPTKAEIRGIKRGRGEISKGNFLSLEELKYELAAANRKKRSQNPRKITR